MIRIDSTRLGLIRQELSSHFGFKGGVLDELWHPVVGLSAGTLEGVGVSVQSVLWSDPNVFHEHSPVGSNALMLSITEYALRLLEGQELLAPPLMLEQILHEVETYAKRILSDELSPTFTLNALQAIDLALWQLHAAQTKAASFDELVTGFATFKAENRQSQLGNIPLISYDKFDSEIVQMVYDGAFLLKIKIGAAGDQSEMLAKDKSRLTQIHRLIGHKTTAHTDSGYPLYYLDANGRYESQAAVSELLDYADSIGILDRIVLLEEPFPMGSELSVAAFPVLVAADESAHVSTDIPKLAERGYRAVALKPIAKTLSASLAVYEEAKRLGLHCFCADLTVPPIMLEWNMEFASRLPLLPGLKTGVIESNGAQNYGNWNDQLRSANAEKKEWLIVENGLYHLGEDFYTSTDFLNVSPYYNNCLG